MKQKDDQFDNLSTLVNNLTLNLDKLQNQVDTSGQSLNDLTNLVHKLETNDSHQDAEVDWLNKQVTKLLVKPSIDPTSSDFDVSQIISLIDEKVGEVHSK